MISIGEERIKFITLLGIESNYQKQNTSSSDCILQKYPQEKTPFQIYESNYFAQS
jgi:hypothetical protein